MFNFRSEFYKRYGNDYELASLELGKSTRTLQRYFSTNECDLTVQHLLTMLNGQWVHPTWDNCYWRSDGNLNTPYGVTRYSDVLLVHRYKWHSDAANHNLKRIKDKQLTHDAFLDDLQDQLTTVLSKLSVRRTS